MTIRIVRISFAVVILIIVITAGVLWQNRPVAWSPERQITGGSGDSRLVDVDADPAGGILHLVWEDDREGSMQAFYKRSLDDGVTWGQDVKLTSLTAQTVEPMPRMATDGKDILVFFSNRTRTGEHLFYVISVDKGSHFSSPLQLTSEFGDQNYPAAAVAGRTFHVVWQGYLDGEEHIFYRRSEDAGSTWQPQIALTNADVQDRHAAIFAVDQKVFVVWTRTNGGQEAIFFRASFDSGATWQPEVQLSSYQAPVFLMFPFVASNGTYVHVVWNGREVLYSRSKDAGRTWDRPLRITDRTRQYLAPRIAVAGSRLQVVTAAILTEGVPGRPKISSDIYYLESPDAGREWTEPVLFTKHAPEALSLAPAIWVHGDTTFVAWQDNRNGRFAIFLKSEPDFAVLQEYQRQRMVPVLAALSAAVLIYALLELKRPAKLKRRAYRKSRLRRRRRPHTKARTKS